VSNHATVFIFQSSTTAAPYVDDRGELFSSSAHAEAHAVQIANELSQNSADAVSVTVSNDSGIMSGRVINAMKKS
jgi:hypothetical protein